MRCRLITLVAFAALSQATPSAFAQCNPTWLPGESTAGVHGQSSPTGGFVEVVRSSTMWDPDGTGPLTPRLVVAGFFAFAGSQRVTSNVAMWDGQTWSALNGTEQLGEVSTVTSTPGGRLLIGGAFGESPIREWSGTDWLPLGTGFDGGVQAIVVRANGHVVAGGNFNTAGTLNNVRGIARWNGTSWVRVGQGLFALDTGTDPGACSKMVLLPNGTIIVGGGFLRAGATTTNITAANNIASLQIATNGTATWTALSSGVVGPDPEFDPGLVASIAALPNNDLVVGGIFTTAGGTPVSNIARWNAASQTWSALGDGFNDAVLATGVDAGGAIVAGGYFSASGATQIAGLARWNGSSWSTIADAPEWNYSSFSYSVESLGLLSDGSLYAAGQVKGGVTRFDGTKWNAIGAGFNGDVTALAKLPSGDVIVSGTFLQAGPTPARRVARLSSGTWHTMGTGLEYTPNSFLVLANGDVLAPGLYQDGSGSTQGRISRWNGSTWTPHSTTDLRAFQLAQAPNGDLYAVGNRLIDGLRTGGLFRWNGTDWLLQGEAFYNIGGGGSFAQPSTLVILPNGHVVVGGIFDSTPTTSIINVARWDGFAWHPVGTGLGNTTLFEGVTALRLSSTGDIYAIGSFVADPDNEVQFNNVARWDGTAWQPLGTGLPPGEVFALFALAISPSGRLVVGGSALHALYEFQNNTWTPLGDHIEGTPWSLLFVDDNTLALAGSQPRVGSTLIDQDVYEGGITSASFAILTCGVATCDSIDFNADGLFPDDTDLIDFLSVLAGGPCTNDPNCNDIDFNNDGLFPDDTDLIAFLSLLAGGNC